MTPDELFGAVVTGRDAAPSIKVSCDVIVVGVGSGGAVLLRELADAGLRAIGIEVGSVAHATGRAALPSARRYAEAGARSTEDGAITLLQGRGVGGSTLTNAQVCRRLPRRLLDLWEREFDVALPSIQDDFDAVEQLLSVRTLAPEEINRNNDLFWKGIRRLGYRGGTLFRPYASVEHEGLSLSSVLTRPALEGGAGVLTDARVERIHHDNERATAVSGQLLDPGKVQPIGEFTVLGRAVILASSAIGSAALALNSGLPDPKGLTGARLHLHPRALVLGFHEERVLMWDGPPQAVECTEFLDTRPDGAHRAWLVGDAIGPTEAAMAFGGFGPELADKMLRLPHATAVRAVVRDRSEGRVLPGNDEHVRIDYRLDDDDRDQIALGMREAARILLSAGAKQVFVPIAGGLWAEQEADLEAVTANVVVDHAPPLTSTNPTSTMCMSPDPGNGVVDAEGRHHYVHNVFVADGALFPTAIGVPLLLPAAAMARRVAKAVAAQLA